MATAKPPIPIEDLEPISIDDLLPDEPILSPRDAILHRKLNPPPARFGDPTPRPAPRLSSAIMGGVGDLITGAARSVTTDRPEALAYKMLTEEGRKEITEPMAARGRELAAMPAGPRRALGLVGGVVPMLGPLIEQIGQPAASSAEGVPVTAQETENAVRAGTTATGMLVGPKAARTVVKRLPAALEPARTRLGVRTPSRMMNRMLAEGDPAGMTEAVDRAMDRKNYSAIDPRETGVSNPGLRNLDEIGPVANAREGALKTRTQLEDLHQTTQNELTTKFANVQVPPNELMQAIQEPILKRLQDVSDAVAPGSIDKLANFMQRHTNRFIRETGGATDPATINAYKKSLYDLLNSNDFKKAVGDDPSLHGILREQANGLMQLVNRYTTDPSTGISSVSEYNRAYGDMRTALDAWEGLIVRREVGRARSGIMAPSNLSPEALAGIPVRRGVLSSISEVWNSPWRVTTNANLLRKLAPNVSQPVPRLMPMPPTAAPQGLLPAAPPPPPAALPAANVRPQRLLPPATGDTPQFAPSPMTVPAPRMPTALPPAPIDVLPGEGGWRVREPLNFGEPGPIPSRGEQTIALNPNYTGPRLPQPIKRLSPYEEVTDLFNKRNQLVSEQVDQIVEDRNHNVVLKEIAASRKRAASPTETPSPTLTDLGPQKLDGTIKIQQQRLADLQRDIADPTTSPADRAAYQRDAAELQSEISELQAAKSKASTTSIGKGAGGIAEPTVPRKSAAKSPPRLAASIPTSAAEALGEQPKNAIAPKKSEPKPTAADSTTKLDYSTMSEADLRTELRKATQLRDTYRKMSAGSNQYRKAEDRVKEIESAISRGPKRISANRKGQRIEGRYARGFKAGDGRQALILRADDGSERLVFEDEIT